MNEEDLAKLLIQIITSTNDATNRIVVGTALGVKPNGTVDIQVDGRVINAIATSANLTGSAIAFKTDDGKWYAKAGNTPIVKKEDIVWARKYKSTNQAIISSPFKALFTSYSDLGRLYIGLDRSSIAVISQSVIANIMSFSPLGFLKIVNTGKRKNDWYIVASSRRGLFFFYLDGNYIAKTIDNADIIRYQPVFYLEGFGLLAEWYLEEIPLPPLQTTIFSLGNSISTRQYKVKSFTITKNNVFQQEWDEYFYYQSIQDTTQSSIDMQYSGAGNIPLADGTIFPYVNTDTYNFNTQVTSPSTSTTITSHFNQRSDVTIWFYCDDDNFGYSTRERIYNFDGIIYNGADGYESRDERITCTPGQIQTTFYLKWKGNIVQLDNTFLPFGSYIPVNPSWTLTPESLLGVTGVPYLYAPLDLISAYRRTRITSNSAATLSESITTQQGLNPLWVTFVGREIDAYLYIDQETTYWYTGYISNADYLDIAEDLRLHGFINGKLDLQIAPRNKTIRYVTNLTIAFTGFKKINTRELDYSIGNPNYLIIESKSNHGGFIYNPVVVKDIIYSVPHYFTQEAKKRLVYKYEVVNNAIKMTDILVEKTIPVRYDKAYIRTDISYYPS